MGPALRALMTKTWLYGELTQNKKRKSQQAADWWLPNWLWTVDHIFIPTKLKNVWFNIIWLAQHSTSCQSPHPSLLHPTASQRSLLVSCGDSCLQSLILRFQSIAVSIGLKCCYGYWNGIMQCCMCSTERSREEQGKLSLTCPLICSHRLIGFSEGH